MVNIPLQLIRNFCLVILIILSFDALSDDVIITDIDIDPQKTVLLVESFLLDEYRDVVAGASLNRPLLAELYQQRDFKNIWVAESGLNRVGKVWFEELQTSEMHGLDPDDYLISIIQDLLVDQSHHLLELELMLSEAFIHYSNDMITGRQRLREAALDWHLQNDISDPVDALKNISSATEIEQLLQSYIPDHAGYRRLKEKLAEYNALNGKNEWRLLGEGPALRKGVRHNQVINLRNQLRLIGDFDAEMQADPYYFSDALEQAVKRFQNRHHLVADGVVGKASRQELNVPIEERINQIKLSLERWRWLPELLGDQYIWINLASSDLVLIENGKNVLTMRSIIGRPYRSTPSLNSEISTIVINPEWVIPRTLAVEDLLPMQQASGDYLQKKNIRVLTGWDGVQSEVHPDDIDWNALNENYFPYQLRQSPGPHNSLGRFKFLFKNPFEIYLHDTPAKRLFDLEKRTFSSGCIRIEQPDVLAKYLLQGEPLYSAAFRSNVLSSDETRYIRLARKMPVYIVYMTAWVEGDDIHFQRDFYDRDRPILQAMSHK